MTKEFEVEPKGERTIRVSRVLPFPPRAIYEAFSDTALVQQWMTGPPGFTFPICEHDLRVGGRIRYVWRSPDGNEMGLSGTFTEIDPPHRLVHTELFDEDWTDGETTVTATFDAEDGGTRVAMEIEYSSSETRDRVMSMGVLDATNLGFDRIVELLS